MSNRTGRGARLLLATAAAAALLALACTASPVEPVAEGVGEPPGVDAGADAGVDAGADAGVDAGVDAGADAGVDAGIDGGADAGVDAGADAGTDAGVLLGAPCERTVGVCAGAVRARLEDGGFEPLCTGASYGPDYEPSETRCDGLDNDCDGETDRHWAVLHPRAPGTTWDVPAARVDAGFVVLAYERDSPIALRRFDDGLQPLAPGEELPLPGPGNMGASALFPTSQGLGLTYLRREIDRDSLLFAPLSREGSFLRGDDGAPLISPMTTWLHPAYGGMQSAPSHDGTRVLTAFHSTDAGTSYAQPPDAVVGLVTDALGTVLTAPTDVMRLRPVDGASELRLESVVAEGSGFLVAVSEGTTGATPWTLRLQRLSSTLEPVGEERTLEVGVEPDAQLARIVGTDGQPRAVLAYRDRDAGGGAFRIRVLRDLFDGGQPQTWAEVPRGTPWLGLQGTSRGVQLAWKAQEYCPECNTSPTIPGGFRGGVFVRGESSGVVELTPGPGDLLFDAFSRPGVRLTSGPDGWMTFFLPVMNDSGVELRAVNYCMP